jgi:ssDNA-binding Zn-finger/Zn-ribbon topoisomerase 1
MAEEKDKKEKKDKKEVKEKKDKKGKTVKCQNCGHDVNLKAKKKEKRAPSKYNIFMGSYMNDNRKEGLDHKILFANAVQAWNDSKGVKGEKGDPEPKKLSFF